MIIYYVVGMFVTVLGYFGTCTTQSGSGQSQNRLSWPSLLGCTLTLTLFAGFRRDVGSDYAMYARFFEAVVPHSFQESLRLVPQEPGFVSVMMFSRMISSDPRFFFCVSSFLAVFPTLLAIRRLSTSPTWSIFLYFFLTYYAISMNSVRQSIAVSLLFLAESFRRQSRLAWASLCVLAFFFHSSALIALLAQTLASSWRPTMRSIVFALVIGGPVLLVLSGHETVRDVAGSLNPRYDTYYGEAGGGIGTLLILLWHVILLLFVMHGLRQDFFGSGARFLNYAVLSVLITALAASNWVFARLEPYFGIYFVILIPAAFQGSKSRRPAIVLSVISSLIYFGFHAASFNDLVPYKY